MVLLALILAAAAATTGSASASGLDLKGDMSLIDGTVITAIFTGMAAVIGAIGGIFWKVHREPSTRHQAPSTSFSPVGYLLGTDGDLDIENETLTRKFNHSFTLKGRIH